MTEIFFAKADEFLKKIPAEFYFATFVGFFFVRNILMPPVRDDYSYSFIWDGNNGGNI